MDKETVQKLVNVFRYITWIKVIAITGGPCGGKSTFLKMAIKLLEKWGIVVIVVPEVARELIASGIRPWDTNWKKSTDFQKHILFNILEKEAAFFRVLSDMNLEDKKVVFLCDRGIPDGAAYCGDEAFDTLLEELGTNRSDVTERYDAVIHLVTAAIGAESFYVTDEERHETLEQAAAIDLETQKAWRLHQHFSLVSNNKSFDAKILDALLALKRTIPMSDTALEIERKFIFKNKFSLDLIPSGTQFYAINQDYLDRPDRPGIECRVREKIVDGVSSYAYTEKTSTEVEGVRGENEEKIDRTRYEELKKLYGQVHWRQIKKKRYKIPLGDLIMELDVFEGDLRGHVSAEIEFKSAEEMKQFIFPPLFDEMIDVTSDERYSNASLAKFGFQLIRHLYG
jgi:CYTH domain-containing protein/predicted ATPase